MPDQPEYPPIAPKPIGGYFVDVATVNSGRSANSDNFRIDNPKLHVLR
jgi:hypothetical protein